MVLRGIIKEKPSKVNNGVKFMIWILALYHRYHYPNIICNLIIGGIISYKLDNIYFLYGWIIFIEIFYLSLAFHETCHMSFAKLINVEVTSISIVPYSIETRVNFNKEKKIAPPDLYAIILAGPVIPIILGFIFIIIAKIFELNIVIIFFCAFFMAINIISLLPFKGSDGQRVLYYIRKKPEDMKILLESIGYYFYKKISISNKQSVEK